MKIHVGCGCVYLKGYLNIDAAPHYLIENAPTEILNQNTTTIDNYYKHDFCMGSGKCVADLKALIGELPFESNQIEEIVMLHVLEHFPYYKIPAVLNEFFKILKPGGKFYVAVPDIKGTAELLTKAKTPEEEDWAIRLIAGTQRSEFFHHYCSFTERTLKKLLSEYGFGNFKDLPNINFYPAIHLEAFKIKR